MSLVVFHSLDFAGCACKVLLMCPPVPRCFFFFFLYSDNQIQSLDLIFRFSVCAGMCVWAYTWVFYDVTYSVWFSFFYWYWDWSVNSAWNGWHSLLPKKHLKSEINIFILCLEDAFLPQTHKSIYKYKQLLNQPIYFIHDHFTFESSCCVYFLWAEFGALTRKP